MHRLGVGREEVYENVFSCRYELDGQRYYTKMWHGTTWCRIGAYRLGRVSPIRMVEVPHRVGPLGLSDEQREWIMSFLRRAAAGDVQAATALTKAATEWAKKYPALHEYLTVTKYPDGGQRQTATLLAFVDGAEWKVLLKDRDTSQGLWTASGSLGEALDDLEAMLKSPAPPWKKDKPTHSTGGKKK